MINDRNSQICELRAQNESIKLDNIKFLHQMEEVESQIGELNGRLANQKISGKQKDMVIQSLQQDLKSKNSDLLDLKNQHR